MTLKKSDDAVSPVIGVMLMLVVTVVIAAAVTIFATGVVGETEVAPVAALDVKILSSVEALEGMNGPELFITHLSGDSVDTKDIELRFSWTHDGCSHYSTYSAEGFKKEVGNYNARKQALYVKSTMSHERTEYGSGALDHYFGDVILTPGLKLTATSEFLPGYNNVGSPYMDFVFNNYNTTSTTSTLVPGKTTYEPNNSGIHGTMTTCTKNRCPFCKLMRANGITSYDDMKNYCEACASASGGNKVHRLDECGPGKGCACEHIEWVGGDYVGGIMDHLPAGTAVDVMIIHIPSGKAIYDNTVIVQ